LRKAATGPAGVAPHSERMNDQNTKMQQTVIASLQMLGPAAMTRASAMPLARQIPALGDRLMVGLQTLTLPV
jgi:hypothetical protein